MPHLNTITAGDRAAAGAPAPTPSVRQRIHAEHQKFRKLVLELETLSRHLAGSPGPAAYRALDAAIADIDTYAGAHMELEETTVYPLVSGRLSSKTTVRALLRDHRQLRRLTDQLRRERAGLESAAPARVARCCSTLHSLAVLLRLHLRREEAAIGAAILAGFGTDAH